MQLGTWLAAVAVLVSGSCGLQGQTITDYHQHLLSPAVAKFTSQPKPVTAGDLVPMLDAAGIRRALILSQGYQFGNPNRPAVQDEYEQVKAENDWTAHQVALYPDRLRAFCGVDPLKDYAIAEIGRCAKDPYLHFGLKLHFGNSDVDLENPRHIELLRKVFEAANAAGMPIAVHMHPSVNRGRPYGAKQAGIFLKEVLPAAPNVAVQIAHLAGAGGYDDPSTDQALMVFVDAIAKHDPRVDRLFFDVSGVAGLGKWTEKADLIAKRIRQLGAKRVLYGSDGPFGEGLTPAHALQAFRTLPLSKAEIRTIESNEAPYMK